ncbi:MAG: hypothetical protein CVU14_00215 [Bacteroidetes bacterium HGW-Bacteroidetes-9]|nr:MAG: hypothetical protein CVU14_00215 [Bacteroidetes bacterium HGW-Bacteroidetes-9]
MKNRNLLVGLLVLMFGTGVFVLTTSGTFRQVVTSPVPGDYADGVTDGWDYLSQIRSNQLTGQVNPADVLKARNTFTGLKSASSLGLNWTSMGPDNYAGRTRALILDNRVSTGATIYAGSVAGGLWKSTTRGLTWNSVETGSILLNVSCMAQSPNGDIYVGSGESFASERFNLFSGFIGHGIYKSTDGNTFTKLASTDPGSFNNPDAEWAFVNKLAAGDNNRVFAATNGGLKYSTDGGTSWSMAKAGTEDLSGFSSEVKIGPDGAVAASVNNQLYISSTGDANGFVLRSTGVGQDSLPSMGLSRIEVAFAPSEASTIYAVLVADGSVSGYLLGQLQGVYVSKDKGITWRLVGPGASTIFNVFGNFANTIHRGNYSACITVDASNPDIIYLGGVNIWEGKKIQETGFYQWQQKSVGEAGTYFHSIVQDKVNAGNFYFASDRGLSSTGDNLQTFKTLNRNYLTSMFYTVAYDDKGRTIGGSQGEGVIFLDRNGNTPETGNKILSTFIGGSVEMSMVNPNSMFYSSTAGFMTRSQDLGVSEANDFVPAEISGVNSGVLITPFRLWESFNNQNSRDSVIFKADMNYAAGAEVTVKSKNSYTSSQKFPFKHILDASLAKGDSIKVKDIISTRFFLGVTNAVYMTKEVLDFSKEPQWFKIATIAGIPSSMAYSSDANYLFVGTTDGKLIRIANIALAYDSIHADVSSSGCIISNSVIKDFTGRYITSVSVDPKNDNHVLVTLGNYGNNEFVFRSVDALAQTPAFTSVQGNLPAMPVYASLIEMTNSNRVIIGTDLGVFTTESLGSNTVWTAENNGMGALPVMMIRQQTAARPWIDNITGVSNLGAIYIATQGKGIYENRLFVGIYGPDSPVAKTSESLIVFPNPVSSEINVKVELPVRSAVIARVFNLKGELVNKTEFGSINKGEHQLTIQAGNLQQGTYLLQLSIGNDVKTAKFVVVK